VGAKVVFFWDRPEGNIAELRGQNFSVLIEANSRYLFCYMIIQNKRSCLHSALPAYSNP